jgi:predicted nucleotidyltransferase component of viral defense system
MIEDVLTQKIQEYAPATAIEQENVLQEMMQHFVLASLGRAGFFSKAAFHGGTFLRIVHHLNRFSENLDFVLKKPADEFEWGKYLSRVVRDCTAEGIRFELLDKSTTDSAVKKAFLKTDSIGKLLLIDLPHSRYPKQKLKIKLEIDINPPEGSSFETHYLAFPVMTALTTQDMPSAFASKTHALLCRTYTKGRDWYDFLWYVNRNIHPNLELLANAVDQVGPWEGQSIDTTPEWFIEQLRETIRTIDWSSATQDVQRFLPAREQESLKLWSTDFFLYHADKLEKLLL